MSPSLVKALVKRTRRPEKEQANAPPASKAIVKTDEDQSASSSSHVDNIISHSSAALKIMEGLSDLAGIPALKVVAGALARFLELVDQVRKNKEDYMELALAVYETIKAAKDEIIQLQESLTDLENFTKIFRDFETDLLEMVYDVERLMKQSFLQKVWSTSTTKDTLKRYQDRLNRKTWILMMRNTVVSRVHVEVSIAEESLFGDYVKVRRGQMELLHQLPLSKILRPHSRASEYAVIIGDARKTVRFYEGENGLKRLKGELKHISQFRHPQLGHPYGICRSLQHPTLIFQQELKSVEFYKLNEGMTPIENICLIYDCVQAFVNARDYLISQCEELKRLSTLGVLKDFVVNMDNGWYALGYEMRLTPDGCIAMLLSVANTMPAPILNGDPIISTLEGRGWPIHNMNPTKINRDVGVTSLIAYRRSAPTMVKLMEYHSTLFAIGKSSFGYIGHEDLGKIRCRRTVKWGSGINSFSNTLDFSPHIRITPEHVQQISTSERIKFDLFDRWIRFSIPCSESSDHFLDFAVTLDMRGVGNVWASQMAYVYKMLEMKFKHLRSYGRQCVEFLHPSYWNLTIQTEFTSDIQRRMALPSTIYLFVSFVAGIGGNIEPDWYWSWRGNGNERLTRTERLQFGIFGAPYLEASLKTERITWCGGRLRAIHSLHESYGFKPESQDAAKALGVTPD